MSPLTGHLYYSSALSILASLWTVRPDCIHSVCHLLNQETPQYWPTRVISKASVSTMVILNQWSRERQKGFNSIFSHLELQKMRQFYFPTEICLWRTTWLYRTCICLHHWFISSNKSLSWIYVSDVLFWQNLWGIFSITNCTRKKKTSLFFEEAKLSFEMIATLII